MIIDQSRRAFLKRSAALGLMGTAAPFALNLAGIGEAAASTATDYKALVCIFLYGGNDYANTLTPYDTGSYTAYQSLRSNIAYARSDLAATVLNPATPLAGGLQYALAPALAPLLSTFDAGKLAVMLNVGTLIQPTTKAQYLAKSVPLPPKLFSHNDQQSFWQASSPEGATSGWGGRMGDLFQAGNGTASVTCINTAGNAVFLTGKAATQYSITSAGPIALSGNTSLYGSATASSVLKAMITAPRPQIIENEQTRVTKRSLDLFNQVTAALAAGPAIATPSPAGNPLADQLRIVARMISVAQELGAKRQVFFVSAAGSFDLHSNLVTAHPPLLAQVANAMKAFYDTTVELGVADRVTAFTASDFGRTLVSNATNGADHGWGSMHFALGGAVKGKKLYGASPVYANNGPDDVGQGRLVPTMAVDQYAATLASWFGVSDANLPTVLPYIGNYTASARNVGFV